MGGHTDDTGAADGLERKGQGVVTAVDVEPIRAVGHHRGGGGHVAGGVLHPHDGGDVAGQRQGELRTDPPARSDRDVVEEHREVRGLGDGSEVGRDPGR
jgi:hypothetical protein